MCACSVLKVCRTYRGGPLMEDDVIPIVPKRASSDIMLQRLWWRCPHPRLAQLFFLLLVVFVLSAESVPRKNGVCDGDSCVPLPAQLRPVAVHHSDQDNHTSTCGTGIDCAIFPSMLFGRTRTPSSRNTKKPFDVRGYPLRSMPLLRFW